MNLFNWQDNMPEKIIDFKKRKKEMLEPQFSLEEVAESMGVSIEKFIAFLEKEGMIDEHGSPTKLGIEQGIWC